MIEEKIIERTEKDALGRFFKGTTKPKKIDPDNRTIEGVASTIQLDRDGEIILPLAFKKDKHRFLESNAPFTASHLHRSSDAAPTQIGWVMEMSIAAAEVVCKFKFSKTSVAGEWWQLASDAAGKGIAFSIGFIPRKGIVGTVSELVRTYPELKEPLRGMDKEDRIRVFTEIELLEISAVMAPSNRQSLQREFSAKLESKEYSLTEKDHAAIAEKVAELIGEKFDKLADSMSESVNTILECMPSSLDYAQDDDLSVIGDAGDESDAGADGTDKTAEMDASVQKSAKGIAGIVDCW